MIRSSNPLSRSERDGWREAPADSHVSKQTNEAQRGDGALKARWQEPSKQNIKRGKGRPRDPNVAARRAMKPVERVMRWWWIRNPDAVRQCLKEAHIVAATLASQDARSMAVRYLLDIEESLGG